ncbi:MAG: 3-methyl-2-oxobutanoate hydroxymethyltransferase [Desulfovibrionaceae bacterium]|nr:3-methyl-2-oxobutanoate hydroxymethyltransferase [Desulfovibrionaceae bacterium]
MPRRLSAPDILAQKGQAPICVMTAYDYPGAVLADRSGADMVLVGDSLGMVVLGYQDTLSVTMADMLHHTRAVSRGVERALVVGDMPFMSFQPGVEMAVANAGRFLAEAGARAVKVEGGRDFAPQIRAMVRSGIPVMGHIGLTPQFIAGLGGFRTQGKTAEATAVLRQDALALAEAGCFCLVLEAMPEEAAQAITESVPIPTIGIGAGRRTDGQVLVMHDVLGLFERFTPRFAKRYAELGKAAQEALVRFCGDVRERRFPAEEHVTHLSAEELERLNALLAGQGKPG